MDGGIIGEIIRDGEKLFLVLGAGVFTLWIVLHTVHATLTSLARERTRREIAAYIAEGSMTPGQGEGLIKAGKKTADSA